MTNDFVLDWERALGFKSDPFADKILEPVSKFMINRNEEKEKINWFFIKGYFYGSIIGEHGVGKSTLLKWLQERLDKYAKVHCVYINAAVFKEQINLLNQILDPLLSYYESYWSKPHQRNLNFDHVNYIKKKLGDKSVALLIDNAHNLTDRNLDIIKSLREDGLRIQVIVATTQADYEKSRLGELGHDELNINLRRFTFEESKELIRKRVEAFGGQSTEPLNDETLKLAYEKADKNPRQFLHHCRDEAIKILIHKKELARNLIQKGQPFSDTRSKFKKRFEKSEPKTKVEHKQGQVSQAQEDKKKFFNVKFDFGKKQERTSVHGRDLNLLAPSKIEGKTAVGNEKYNQELLNKLTGVIPKKKSSREQVSDVDKILKDLSDDID